jgi:hypothetical protein
MTRQTPCAPREEVTMGKPTIMSGTAVAVAAAWALLLSVGGHQAAAQSGQFYVITADFEIVAADFDKYVALAKENAAASIKDPGCHEFNIAVSAKIRTTSTSSRSGKTQRPWTRTVRAII